MASPNSSLSRASACSLFSILIYLMCLHLWAGSQSSSTKAIRALFALSFRLLISLYCSYCICDNPKGYWAVDGGSVKQLLLLNGGHLGGRFQTTTITKAIFSKSVSATQPNTTFQFFQSGWIPPKAYGPRFKRSILLATFNLLIVLVNAPLSIE